MSPSRSVDAPTRNCGCHFECDGAAAVREEPGECELFEAAVVKRFHADKPIVWVLFGVRAARGNQECGGRY